MLRISYISSYFTLKLTKMHLKNTKKLSLILFTIGTLCIYSCKEKPKTDNKNTTNKTETVTPAVKATTPATSADGVALNPSHGQPGHRCDIAVGAPLNSKPAPIQTNTQKSDVLLDNSSSTTLPKGTLNPPLGQPGHSCAVKVGEPL